MNDLAVFAAMVIMFLIGMHAVVLISTERQYARSRREADEALIVSMLHIWGPMPHLDLVARTTLGSTRLHAALTRLIQQGTITRTWREDGSASYRLEDT